MKTETPAEPTLENLWEDNPDYPVADWKREVQNDETKQSYIDWVNEKTEA